MSASAAKLITQKVLSGLAKPSSSIPKPVGTSGTKSNEISRSNSPNPAGLFTENTDDFVVGDRVWVGGTKSGRIQYIGDTQFAPGEWAGVVLDDTIGKNDGSVAGVRYFQCEPKRGVFSRLTKLSREPIPSLIGQDGSTDDISSPKANGSVRSASPRPCSTPVRMTRSSTPSSLSGGDSSSKLRVGERVQVTSASGVKTGTLRYLGATDFAAGEWAGVELDEAIGKNDGSVAGKRYFSCADKRGLFAPVHKVSKQGSGSASRRVTTSSTAAVSTKRTTSTPKRTGSHESVNTIGSTSSASRSIKPRLGVTSLTSTVKPSRGSAASITATHAALQDALKEKEQHIEQLLKERDLERSEVARAASRVEEVERELGTIKTDFKRFKEDHEKDEVRWSEKIETSEKERRDLEFQLEEEKKKVEDLQFRVEEEFIVKTELEGAKEAELEKFQQLEELYASEKAKVERLERESNSNFQNEELLAKHLDEIETLQRKLEEREKSFKDLESTKTDDTVRYAQVMNDLVKKETEVAELKAVIQEKNKCEAEQRTEHAKLEEVLLRTQKDLQQHLLLITELKTKLVDSDDSLKKINQQFGSLEITCADQKRKLQAAEERCEQMALQKSKLEKDISDQIKSSGDSSTHLSQLNDQLRSKEKEIESLQLRLQGILQEKEKCDDIHRQVVIEHQTELVSLKENYEVDRRNLEEKLKDALNQLQMVKKSVENERQQMEVAITTKNTTVTTLEEALAAKEFQLSKISDELKQARTNSENVEQKMEELKALSEQKMTEMLNELNILKKEKQELVAVCGSTDITKFELEKQLERLQHEKQEQVSAVTERDKKLLILNQEVDRLKAEFNDYKAELLKKLAENELDQQTFESMRNLAESQQKSIEELQEVLRVTEEDRDSLKEMIDKLQASMGSLTDSESKIVLLERRCEELKQSEERVLHDSEAEKEALQKMIDSLQGLLEQKVKESERQQEEVVKLKQALDSRGTMAQTLEEKLRREVVEAKIENQRLVKCNEELENRWSSQMSTNGNSVTDSLIHELTKEREALKGQIDFLNSVIVDMHKKNDDLEARLHIMEVGGGILNTSSGGSDVNLNAIKNVVVAPRVFCDICDMFDLHDTEDCPRQATSDSPPPSQYHGQRGQDRPYCETCEIFGHWTNECDDNETF